MGIQALISVLKSGNDEKVVVKYLYKTGNPYFFENLLIPLCKREWDASKIKILEVYTEESLDNNRIYLAVHTPLELFTGYANNFNNVNRFSQELLCLPNEKRNKTKLMPIIHICLSDLFRKNLYGNAPLHKEIPRSYPIMDSSIWNYLVMINKHPHIFVMRLFKIVNKIYDNYKENLYSLEVAREYADINARLAKESFLSGTHAFGVSPFIFHSESAIERMIRKEFRCNILISDKKNSIKNRSTIKRIVDQQWRLLLVDDKAFDQMSTFDNSTGKTKLEVIKSLLESQLGLEGKIKTRKYNGDHYEMVEEPVVLIEYAETKKQAKEALQRKKYDVILLDYLLDKDGTQYGYEILNNIFNEIIKIKAVGKDMETSIDNLSYKIGPHSRLFFIFISAYSTAVYERLLAEGLNRSEKYWHIAVGACPTNTPQLFLYNLLKLMEKQLEDSGVNKLSANGIYDVVNNIYGETNNGEDNGKPVRYRANKLYREVLNMHNYYRKMLKDVQFPTNGEIFNTEGSVLITNFIRKNVNLGGFLEHLTQLIHLTAFGTVRQWPEMWEEYIYFKSQFNIAQFEEECKSFNWDGQEKFKELCVAIEDHILNLKSDVG